VVGESPRLAAASRRAQLHRQAVPKNIPRAFRTKRLPSLTCWYFEPRRIEQAANGRIYVLLGVRLFKRYLPTSGDLISRFRRRRRIAPIGPDLVDSLLQYEKQTKSWEARHIFGALSMLALTWWSIAVHGKGSWPALLGANLLINGYPIMLQRYNRARLRSILAHLEGRQPKSTA
jgi:hypothetical protein